MSSNNFITHGKFVKGKDPEHEDDYIGYLRFTEINGQQARLDIDVMYFRGYDVKQYDGTNLDPGYHEIVSINSQKYQIKYRIFSEDFDSSQEYFFDCVNLRIPPTFTYQAIFDTTPDVNVNEKVFNYIPVTNNPSTPYSGLALLNIHEKIDSPSSRRTIPQRAHLKKGEHFSFSEDSAGKFGCNIVVGLDNIRKDRSPSGFIVKDKIPLFVGHVPWDSQAHKDVTEECFLILTLGVDNTVGYCAARKSNEKSFIDEYLKKSLSDIVTTDALGVALHQPLFYAVPWIIERFGVFLVPCFASGWNAEHGIPKQYFT